MARASKPSGATEDLKYLLEFMRIKAPEMQTVQVRLARIIFPFFVLNILLFPIMYSGGFPLLLDEGALLKVFSAVTGSNLPSAILPNVAPNIPPSSADAEIVNSSRRIFIGGTLVAIFFYYMRFGYLFYQGMKDVVSVQRVIDKIILPHKKDNQTKDDQTYEQDMRKSLIQLCKSNYIAQSVVVFLYPSTKDGEIAGGPLAGSHPGGVLAIRIFMPIMILCFVWFMSVSQFMMMMGFLLFTNKQISFLVFGSFACYHGFLILYVWSYVWRQGSYVKNRVSILRRFPIIFLSLLFTFLFGWSSLVNLQLWVNHAIAADFSKCPVPLKKIEEVSSFAVPAVSFLFTENAKNVVNCNPLPVRKTPS